MEKPIATSKDVLTTGQVAEVCGVGSTTVLKWCKSGALPSYRIALSQHRRIERQHLLAFLVEHDMPTDRLTSPD